MIVCPRCQEALKEEKELWTNPQFIKLSCPSCDWTYISETSYYWPTGIVTTKTEDIKYNLTSTGVSNQDFLNQYYQKQVNPKGRHKLK